MSGVRVEVVGQGISSGCIVRISRSSTCSGRRQETQSSDNGTRSASLSDVHLHCIWDGKRLENSESESKDQGFDPQHVTNHSALPQLLADARIHGIAAPAG